MQYCIPSNNLRVVTNSKVFSTTFYLVGGIGLRLIRLGTISSNNFKMPIKTLTILHFVSIFCETILPLRHAGMLCDNSLIAPSRILQGGVKLNFRTPYFATPAPPISMLGVAVIDMQVSAAAQTPNLRSQGCRCCR